MLGEIDSKTFIVSTTINGNVEGQDAEMVQLINVIVNGNVGIVGGGVDDTAPFTFDYSRLHESPSLEVHEGRHPISPARAT